MNRKISREKIESEKIKIKEKIKIGVIGIGNGSGCTFVATSLAFLLSRDKERAVGYVQIGDFQNSSIYDSLGMDKRFAGREFVDFYELIVSGVNIRTKINMDEKINWAVIPPREVWNLEDTNHREKTTPVMFLKLINNLYCNTVVCDFDYKIHEESLYQDMDVIVCVVDPMPSKLLSFHEIIAKIKKLQLKEYKVIWILNKMNEGVNKRELKEYLKLKEYHTIPLMEGQLFYRAEYNCRIPFNVREIEEISKAVFEEIIKTI